MRSRTVWPTLKTESHARLQIEEINVDTQNPSDNLPDEASVSAPMTEAPVTSTAEAEQPREHGLAVTLLIVLGAIILLVTSFNVWVDRAALNTDNWVDAADELIADPEVREAVSVYIVDQLYANVDVSGGISDLLPSDLSGLSGPLAAALRNPATDAVDRLLSTQAAAEVWSAANRLTHETIVRILEDDGEFVSTAGGAVTLDLRGLVVQLADSIGLPGTVVDQIPADVGQVTVVQSQRLEDLQNAVTFVQWASWILFFVVLGIFVGAVFLASNWRRAATRNVGIAVLIVGLLLIAGLRFGGDRLLDGIVDDESNRAAAEAVWRIGSELLRDMGITIAWIGIVLILGAVIAGTSRGAVALRRFVAPAFTGSAGIRWGIGAVVFLLLVWWAPLAVFTTWIGMIVLAAVLAAAIEGYRGLCLYEAGHAHTDTADEQVPQAV